MKSSYKSHKSPLKALKDAAPASSVDESPDIEAEFPLHALPMVVADMVSELSASYGVPASLVAPCALGIVSAALGVGLRANTSYGATVYGNLFILGFGASGSGKSLVFGKVAAPFLELEQKLLKTWREETLPNILAAQRAAKAQMSSLEAKVKKACGAASTELFNEIAELERTIAKLEEAKQEPVMSVADTTSEKLLCMLKNPWECLASLCADGRKLVDNLLGRYNKLDSPDESVYLHAFSGDHIRVDRISRPSVVLESPRMTILWLAQPDILTKLLEQKALTEGGCMPRFLLTGRDCLPKKISDRREPRSTILEPYNDLIVNLTRAYRLVSRSKTHFQSFVIGTTGPEIIGSETVYTLPVSCQAEECLNKYHDELIDRRTGELEDVGTYASRWAEIAFRIALCIHAMKHGGSAHLEELQVDTAESAVEVMTWFMNEQLRLLGAGRENVRKEKCSRVERLIASHLDGVSPRDVVRARIVESATGAKWLLDSLVSEGVLVLECSKPERGGHSVLIYRLAPGLIGSMDRVRVSPQIGLN